MNAPPDPQVAIHFPSGEMAAIWRSPNPNLRSGCVTTSAREQSVKAKHTPRQISRARILFIRREHCAAPPRGQWDEKARKDKRGGGDRGGGRRAWRLWSRELAQPAQAPMRRGLIAHLFLIG